MCGMCGTPLPPPRWFMVGVEESSSQTIRERAKQINLLKMHLESLRISVHASPASPGLMLQTPDGRSEFILDIGEAWPAVERLVGRAYDPLATLEATSTN